MARGWGGAPPDLKGTLGTLLRTTLIQIGALRDAAVRELRSGASLGSAREWASRGAGLLRSQRTEVLASLGEIIYELALAGELDLEEFPELRDAIGELEAIDNDVAAAGGIPREPNEDLRPLPAASGPAVWRPDPGDYDDSGDRVTPRDAQTPTRPSRPTRPSVQGHIAFVPDEANIADDDDLAEYMHEADVPDLKSKE